MAQVATANQLAKVRAAAPKAAPRNKDDIETLRSTVHDDTWTNTNPIPTLTLTLTPPSPTVHPPQIPMKWPMAPPKLESATQARTAPQQRTRTKRSALPAPCAFPRCSLVD